MFARLRASSEARKSARKGISANWSGRTLSQCDAGRLAERRPGLDQLEFGRDIDKRRMSWLSMTTSASSTTCEEWTVVAIGVVVVDEAELAKDPLLEVGEARALAGAPAAPGHRDAADDAEVELRHVLEAHRLAMRHEPLRGRRGLEIDALGGELFGIDAQIGEALGQIGHRREQQLAVVERPQAHRDLRRIGIAFDDPRLLPGVELAQPLGGGVGADEIGDAVEGRPDVDARRDEPLPHPVAHGGLGARSAPPSAIGLRSSSRPLRPLAATGAAADALALEARATRSARSSRQGGAMTCTPIGSVSPSVQTGTAATGRPMNEIGWVKTPMFGRTSISLPSSTKVFWPSCGARHGRRRREQDVDVREQVERLRRETSGGISAPATTQAPGSIAPAIRRSRTSGSKSLGARRAGARDAAPRLRPW